jgi:CheY-like chemotaxis protein
VVRVEASDTGIGIERQQLARLFEVFEQADQTITRRFGGTGLGLPIAKRLVELMGGRIGASSAPGSGSVFWFELPMPPAPVPSPGASAAGPAGPAASGRPARILVVDDVATNRQLVGAVLKAQGHAPVLVGDGEEAVERALAEPFDLILMDVNMPRMDGLAATRAIRQGGGPNALTPILALTANAFPEEVTACRSAGMDDHLAKPIDQQRLRALLARHLREAPARADP